MDKSTILKAVGFDKSWYEIVSVKNWPPKDQKSSADGKDRNLQRKT